MKKNIIIFVVVAIILGVGIFFITNKKVSITGTEFKNIMKEKNYVVNDAKNQFESYDYIKKVYIAASSDYSYQIEFYEMSDSNKAMSFYNTNKNIFESDKGSLSSNYSVNISNYSKYSLSSDSSYKVISRIDNTVIYVNSKKENKDKIKKVLKKLGY